MNYKEIQNLFSKDIKKVFVNFGYLSLLQLVGIVGPIIIFPFLVKILGKENYGLIVFAQATITFFVVIVNFGFNITATQQISINIDNKKKIDEIVSSVLILKFFLVLFCVFLLTIILPIIPQAKNNYLLFYTSLYLCLNELLLPVWYFQGIEEMKYITFLNSTSKILSLVLILLVVKVPNDYVIVPFIYLISTILMGFFALRIVFVVRKVNFCYPKFTTILSYAKSSFYIFLSRASFVVMENTSKILIATYLGLSELAVYDFLLKITEALRKPFSLLSQAFFPNLSKTKDMILSKKILIYTSFIGLFLYILLLFFSDYITIFFLDSSEVDNVFLGFLIVGLIIPLSCLTWGLGENALVIYGYFKEYNISTAIQIIIYFLFTGLAYLIFNELSFKILLLLYILPVFFEVMLRVYYVYKYKIFG